MDVMTELATRRLGAARDIIASAERALGRLSPGQRRDLLRDNTQWSGASIDRVVDLIEQGVH